MKKVLFVCVALAGFTCSTAHAWQLQIYNEFVRVGPDGKVLSQDWHGQPPGPFQAARIAVSGPRNGHISLVIVVSDETGGKFSLDVRRVGQPAVRLELYRAWYHKKKGADEFVPDALVPVKVPVTFSLPAEDNRVAGQKAQMFWLDAWIEKHAQPGPATIEVTLQADSRQITKAIEIQVLPITLPDEDPIAADHNSYGTGWLGGQYPKLRSRLGDRWSTSKELFRLIHAYHRLFYEHRGIFHQLGYGHEGRVSKIFAPELAGYGKNRRIVSWELFEKHYGPLLDGSAFKGSFRPARPIRFMYLPINPEWPARFVLWGTPGYEAEFVSVVRQMAKYFEKRGWIHTKFEMFFNHKKRYKAFCWDGDETRFARDDVFFKEYGRLLHQAIPRNCKAQFVFRHDASWRLAQQWQTLDGVIDLWCCGGGMLSWYPEAPAMLKARGNIVWFYGGTPSAFDPIISITEYPLTAWMWGVDGYCRWLTISPGADPWFEFEGGGTCLAYSGERFGIEGPIPCIRLKLERNAVQDIALFNILADRIGTAKAKRLIARLAGATPEDWWNPKPGFLNTPPWTWDNAMLGDAGRPPVITRKNLDGRWWLKVRQVVIDKVLQEAGK